MNSPTRQFLRIASFLGSVALVSGCQSPFTTPATPATTACAAASAQILVGDGFLQRACGCTEGGGGTVGTNSALTCTVAAGTTVTFHFVGTKLLHQIIANGAPTFSSSPIIDPKPGGVRVHAVRLTTSGTYSFRDLYNPGLRGTITVP